MGHDAIGIPFHDNHGPRLRNRLAGVVESTRHFEVGFRYWPASGIDVRLAAGSDWVRNVDHVEGADRTEPFATLGVRLTR